MSYFLKNFALQVAGNSGGNGMAALEAEAACWSSFKSSHFVKLLAITDKFSLFGWGAIAAYEWIENSEPLSRYLARLLFLFLSFFLSFSFFLFFNLIV